jgi:TonB family protein
MNRHILHERLPMFLLLSLVMHILLLAGFGAPAIEVTRRFLGQPILQVQMQGVSSVLPLSSAPKMVVAHEISTIESVDRLSPIKSARQAIDPSATDNPVAEDQDRHGQEPGSVTETGIRNHLLGQLQTRLSRHLVYPPLARSRGWEGTVLLGLRVESNGHLERIHIEHSSGYAVLDNSALNSLNRLGQLAEASAWLNGRGLDMQLPVIYRLIEN